MKRNYSQFYFNMLAGLTFMVGVMSGIEFGFWSFNFLQVGVIWILGIGLTILYMREKQK